MHKHLVLVGAGHAHMTVLKKLRAFLDAGHRVTVVGPSELHYYSGMGPGMLSGIYRPDEIRFPVKAMTLAQGGEFVEDRVVRVDGAARVLELGRGGRLSYDVVSFNTGSSVPVDPRVAGHSAVFAVKPIENLLAARAHTLSALSRKPLEMVVAGGGPAGVEIAANLRRLVQDAGGTASILLVAGRGLLAEFETRVRRMVRKRLSRLDVAVLESEWLESAQGERVRLASGRESACDLLVLAVGVTPSALFRDSGLPVGEDGGLRVNRFLQSVGFSEIFGGGDCISFAPKPLARVGVYAVRQNPVLFENLHRALKGSALMAFRPQPSYLLAFNMGDGTAVVSWKSFVFDGRPGFALKDYLDRSFMRRFQPG
ncbi:MAG: FAD-dependent oxidoreductase [Desulfobacterales bacterium]